jgi:hypothetical protein
MSRTRTLAQLRADVCDRGDITDGGTTGRHTTANLNRRINQAIQQYQRLVTDSGCTLFVKQVSGTTSTSSVADTAGWAPRDYIAMPSDFYHLEGIDITIGDTTVPMIDFMQLERNAFKMSPSWLASSGVGMPVFYKLGGLNQAGARVAKTIPSAGSVYQYTVWYLPEPADLVADGDVFDGIAGYEEWVVNRAVMDSCLRDQASQPLYSALAAENARLESRMAYEFATAAGPGRRIDTKSLRDRLLQVSFGDWRII